jgi:hypothetical protein
MALKPARIVLACFLREYRAELDAMDLPEKTRDTFILLGHGYNGSRIRDEPFQELLLVIASTNYPG